MEMRRWSLRRSSISACFKIDGIVWKYFLRVSLYEGLEGFKIDGIVWKWIFLE